MVLESTVVCVDGSDYMRNGDFIPTRMLAQQDAVRVLCSQKTRSNAENTVALLVARPNPEVLTTLTTSVEKLHSKMVQVSPNGGFSFATAINVAQLALKHRQGKHHRMRIVVFVGSPVLEDSKKLDQLAKKLRKEKVSVDVINFGGEGENEAKLTAFIETLNGNNDPKTCHILNINSGPAITEPLRQSPLFMGEDGPSAMGGLDINEEHDPDLAAVLRISMEEERARVAAARVAAMQSEGGTTPANPQATTQNEIDLAQALATEAEPSPAPGGAPAFLAEGVTDMAAMTEQQQLEYALYLSMHPDGAGTGSAPMEVSDPPPPAEQEPKTEPKSEPKEPEEKKE